MPRKHTIPCPTGFKQQPSGMTNPYQVNGDYTTILLFDKEQGRMHNLFIDTDRLEDVLSLSHPIYISIEHSKNTVLRYARVTANGVGYRFHRWLFDVPDGLQVDHVNHNGLDNRASNVRFVTHSENMLNRRMAMHNAHRLVLQHKDDPNRWGAWVFLGEFESEEDADAAFSDANAALRKSGYWDSPYSDLNILPRYKDAG